MNYPIKFTKMSGAGNDFILIDHRESLFADTAAAQSFARTVCERKFSVGADGLILIENSWEADFSWQFFNADGSIADMCGNGARCAARFAHAHGIAPARLSFATRVGIVAAEVTGATVCLTMTPPRDLRLGLRFGQPTDTSTDTSADRPTDRPADTSTDRPADRSTDRPADRVQQFALAAGGQRRLAPWSDLDQSLDMQSGGGEQPGGGGNPDTPLAMKGWPKTVHSLNTGVPHLVVFVDDIENVPVMRWGRYFRFHPSMAPAGTNVNFVELSGESLLRVRTYERGVEHETMACGTGAVAAALVAARLGRVGSPTRIITSGREELEVYYHLESDGFSRVRLAGPADFIYHGQLNRAALRREDFLAGRKQHENVAYYDSLSHSGPGTAVF